MEERNHETDSSKIDEVMLPGFRFHPTDEELVGFYLRRKIQHKALSIELIKQLDIYKYDPWDLPKLATVGEREWYFFCPRDRKYRNSTRPNRVTGAGFWKATGTDRPIYSSEGSKCIGLKKSLVFYKGRAAKGTKTDWMMHEFRLPSITDSSTPKRFLDKNIPPNDSWAICRIFKKANSNAHRALSHSWVSPQMPSNTTPDLLTSNHFTSNEMSFLTKASSAIQFSHDFQNSSVASFSPLDLPPYRTINPMTSHRLPQQISISNHDSTTSYTFSNSCTNLNNTDASSLLLNMSSSILGNFGKASEGTMDYNFSVTLPENVEENNRQEAGTLLKEQNVNVDHIGFPVSGFPLNMTADAWKSNLLWESSPCPSDQMSTSYSTNKCYT